MVRLRPASAGPVLDHRRDPVRGRPVLVAGAVRGAGGGGGAWRCSWRPRRRWRGWRRRAGGGLQCWPGRGRWPIWRASSRNRVSLEPVGQRLGGARRVRRLFIQPAAWVGVHGLTLATLLLAGAPLLGWRWRGARSRCSSIWAAAGGLAAGRAAARRAGSARWFWCRATSRRGRNGTGRWRCASSPELPGPDAASGGEAAARRAGRRGLARDGEPVPAGDGRGGARGDRAGRRRCGVADRRGCGSTRPGGRATACSPLLPDGSIAADLRQMASGAVRRIHPRLAAAGGLGDAGRWLRRRARAGHAACRGPAAGRAADLLRGDLHRPDRQPGRTPRLAGQRHQRCLVRQFERAAPASGGGAAARGRGRAAAAARRQHRHQRRVRARGPRAWRVWALTDRNAHNRVAGRGTRDAVCTRFGLMVPVATGRTWFSVWVLSAGRNAASGCPAVVERLCLY